MGKMPKGYIRHPRVQQAQLTAGVATVAYIIDVQLLRLTIWAVGMLSTPGSCCRPGGRTSDGRRFARRPVVMSLGMGVRCPERREPGLAMAQHRRVLAP